MEHSAYIAKHLTHMGFLIRSFHLPFWDCQMEREMEHFVKHKQTRNSKNLPRYVRDIAKGFCKQNIIPGIAMRISRVSSLVQFVLCWNGNFLKMHDLHDMNDISKLKAKVRSSTFRWQAVDPEVTAPTKAS